MDGGKIFILFVLAVLAEKLTNGTLIDSTAEADIEYWADQALEAADDNAVAPCFANEAGSTFNDLKTYAYYGTFEGVLDYTVGVGQTSISLQANSLNLVGAAGLMCYHIEGTDYKVCAAYYSPFNDIFNDNQYNFKIYEQSATNNEEIFKHMLSDSAQWYFGSAGQYWTRSEYGIEMRAVMDDVNKATMALFVDSSNVNPFLGPDLYYGCSFRIGFPIYSCWRECDANNPGWQWTDQSCNSNEDCNNPNELTPDSECFIDGPW